jgi:hypothetical protein
MRNLGMCVVAAALAAIVSAMPAHAAGNSITYVSSTGTDSMSCGATASTACQTLSGALAVTTGGGTIFCLDSTASGPITITESVVIDCIDTNSSITGSGVLVTITGATTNVGLRGLQIVGAGGAGTIGISSTGGDLSIGDCLIHDMKASPALGVQYETATAGAVLSIGHNTLISKNGEGVLFAPTANADLVIDNATFLSNGTSGTNAGLYVKPSSGITAGVSIKGGIFKANYFGIVADGTGGGIIGGAISDSAVSANVQNGITVSTTSTSVVFLVDQTQVAGNANHGLVAGGSDAGMLVRNTSVVGNGGGLFTVSGGTLYSYGTNSVNGNNGNDGSFTGTVGMQ